MAGSRIAVRLPSRRLSALKKKEPVVDKSVLRAAALDLPPSDLEDSDHESIVSEAVSASLPLPPTITPPKARMARVSRVAPVAPKDPVAPVVTKDPIAEYADLLRVLSCGNRVNTDHPVLGSTGSGDIDKAPRILICTTLGWPTDTQPARFKERVEQALLAAEATVPADVRTALRNFQIAIPADHALAVAEAIMKRNGYTHAGNMAIAIAKVRDKTCNKKSRFSAPFDKTDMPYYSGMLDHLIKTLPGVLYLAARPQDIAEWKLYGALNSSLNLKIKI